MVLTAGVSFDGHHFDKFVGVYDGFAGADLFAQSILRCRNFRGNNHTIFMKPKKDNSASFHVDSKRILQGELAIVSDTEKRVSRYINDTATQFRCFLESRRRHISIHYDEYILSVLAKQGFSINFTEQQPTIDEDDDTENI